MQAACALYALGGGFFAFALFVGQVHNISNGLTTHERQRRLHAQAAVSAGGGAGSTGGGDGNAGADGGALLQKRVETVTRQATLANWRDWWHVGGRQWQWRWVEAARADEPHNL